MPGAKTAKNLLKRNVKLAVRIKNVCFSPDGTQFAAATTEGLVIYSNSAHTRQGADFFNPFEIDESVTLENIIAKVQNEEHLTALVLALRLNIAEVTDTVYRCVPVASVSLIVAHMPEMLLLKLLQFLATEIENGREIHWAMAWLEAILKYHGSKFGQQTALQSPLRSCLLQLFSSLQFVDTSLSRVCNENSHLMQFMISQHTKEQEKLAIADVEDQAITDQATDATAH